MVSSASGDLLVTISRWVSVSSVRERSTRVPFAFASTAALARPGPIESLTKSPIGVPAAVCFWLPSGRVTVTLAAVMPTQ
jgi:hypothetical protein